MDFSQVEAQFQRLKRQFEAGALTEVEFKAQLENLMLQDEQGRWWMIGYETGQWYYHDGEKWVRGEPPHVAERRREQVEALCREGAAALVAGDWGAAIEEFEAALALEPGHPEATAGLAEAKARAEEVPKLEVPREPVAPAAAPPKVRWGWVVAGVIGLIFLVVLIPRVIPLGPGQGPAPGPEVAFWADCDAIPKGECTILHWEVPGMEELILNGPGFDYAQLPASGDAVVCLEETARYELKNLDREVIATVRIEVLR